MDAGETPLNDTSTVTSRNSNGERTNNSRQDSDSRSTNDPEVYYDMDFD